MIMDEVNFGGAELSFLTLSQALARRCDVHVAVDEQALANSSIRDWCALVTSASGSIHPCPVPIYPGPRRNLHRWLRRAASKYLENLMNEVQPQAAVVNLPTVERGQTAVDAAELARPRVRLWGYIHSAHLPTTTGARWRLRDVLVPRQLRRFKDRLLTVSAAASKDLAHRYGLAPAEVLYPPIITIDKPPSPVERAIARSAMTQADEFLLGIVGRVNFRHKGQDAAVRVVAQLSRNGTPVRLAVIGDGPDLAAVPRLAEQLGVRDRVTCLGWRPDAGRLIPVLDALLITSRHEGMPLIAMEAAAAEVPVIAYDIDGLTEFLPEPFRVPFGDEAGLAEIVARLLLHELSWPGELMRLRAREWSDPARAAESLLRFTGLLSSAGAGASNQGVPGVPGGTAPDQTAMHWSGRPRG
jgi:glycosyltransferase involved in cell wall biosynthesis